MQSDGKLNVLLIGGGMISKEVIIPTIFQEKSRGKLNEISISSLNAGLVKGLYEMFPKYQFKGYPDPAKTGDLNQNLPDAYKEAMRDLKKPGAVIVATPDHQHTRMVIEAVEAGFDVVCMKPLCLKVNEAHQIIDLCKKKNAYVYTDYHKRKDRAVRAARYKYRKGELGEMLHGHAWIEEPKYMPLKYFGLWAEKSSSFEYIGVHYVDVYYFVTGLKPKRVAAWGQKKFLPKHGSNAYDAVQAVIEWEDNSVFWVQTSWVCSEKNSAMTNQGMQLSGTMGEYWADHKHRNLHFLTEEHGFEQYNPNFFKHYDSWEEEGEVEYVGYGYESIAQGLQDIAYINKMTQGLPETSAQAKRKEIIAEFGKMKAVPEQALIGVAVNDAVRMSIDNNNCYVYFDDKMYPRINP